MVIASHHYYGCYEELGSVCIGSSIRHGEQSRLRVLETECLVRKRISVDALASFTVSLDDVTSLDHKPRNDAVERRPLIVQWFSLLANSLFTCT